MRKIVYDHQTFCLQQYGGISRYFCELATRVHATVGHEAKIVAPLHFNRHLSESSAPQTALRLNVQTPRRGGWCRAADTLLAPVLNRLYAPSLVHRTFYKQIPTPPDVPVVVTVFDMIHELFSEQFSPDDANYHYKRSGIEAADHVLCISECTARDLTRLFGTPRSKISITYLGCSEVFAAAASAGETAPHARPYLLYVGHRGGYKNFDAALRAFAASPLLTGSLDLVLFGGAPLDAGEQALLARLGVADRVSRLAGSDADLARAYRHARAFVYPSLYEGFGIPPLEAMSAGCAVACSNTSSIPEVVGDAAALFDPADTDSIRQSLEALCFNDSDRRRWLAAAPGRLEKFSWERCAADTVNAYARTLSTH